MSLNVLYKSENDDRRQPTIDAQHKNVDRDNDDVHFPDRSLVLHIENVAFDTSVRGKGIENASVTVPDNGWCPYTCTVGACDLASAKTATRHGGSYTFALESEPQRSPCHKWRFLEADIPFKPDAKLEVKEECRFLTTRMVCNKPQFSPFGAYIRNLWLMKRRRNRARLTARVHFLLWHRGPSITAK